MTDYFSTTIETDLGRDEVYHRVVATVPELSWRRGESEAQGALTVSGRTGHGGSVRFWFYDDEIGRTTVEVSLRGVDPSNASDDAGLLALQAKLVDEVFPTIGRVVG